MEDRSFAQRESESYVRSIFAQGLIDGAFEINPRSSKAIADLKPAQLSIARDLGIPIPCTLFSNDPVAIRSFVESSEERVIYKAHTPQTWRISKEQYVPALATQITFQDIQDEHALLAAPGIYQHYVEKAEELRITIMGKTVFQASVIGDEHTDWRANKQRKFRVPEMPLTDQEIQNCFQLMDRLKIVFGCFDFIRTPCGKLVFLEVNEMGQWLFIEQDLPELHMLDAFTQFIFSQDKFFDYKKTYRRKPLTFMDFIQSDRARNWCHDERLRHIEQTPFVSVESTT